MNDQEQLSIDDQYNRAVEATARGETVPNLHAIIQASQFCRDAFDGHVRQERARIAAKSAPRPPLGELGRERAEHWKQIAETNQGEKR